MVIAAAFAAVGAISSVVGGLVGAAQAKARAEFYAKQYEEQARTLEFTYNRQIRKAAGKEIAGFAGQGVAYVGSAIDAVMDSTYTNVFEKMNKKQELYMQAQRALISGQADANQSTWTGFAKGLSSAYTGYKDVKEDMKPKE